MVKTLETIKAFFFQGLHTVLQCVYMGGDGGKAPSAQTFREHGMLNKVRLQRADDKFERKTDLFLLFYLNEMGKLINPT